MHNFDVSQFTPMNMLIYLTLRFTLTYSTILLCFARLRMWENRLVPLSMWWCEMLNSLSKRLNLLHALATYLAWTSNRRTPCTSCNLVSNPSMWPLMVVMLWYKLIGIIQSYNHKNKYLTNIPLQVRVNHKIKDKLHFGWELELRYTRQFNCFEHPLLLHLHNLYIKYPPVTAI